MPTAEGVDDRSWQHHRRRNEYSLGVRDAIGDDELSAEVRRMEDDRALESRAARARVIRTMRRR
jgi:hypothetical protein